MATLEYPTCPPSLLKVNRRSSLCITTTPNVPLATFSPSPTPKSLSFPSPSTFSTPPPEAPPKWLWRCHLCGENYALGATRRCLNDGHYFCAGTTTNKRTGKRKNHSPCGSTFDYIGWQAYGDWRRNEQAHKARHNLASTLANKKRAEHSCEIDCNFPSECRWRTKPITPLTPSPIASVSAPASTPKRKSIEAESPTSTTTTAAPTTTTIDSRESKIAEPSTKEFRLTRSSIRQRKSFSLPFSPYSWLLASAPAPATTTMEDGAVASTSPTSPLPSTSSTTSTSLGMRKEDCADEGVELDGKIEMEGEKDERLWLLPVLGWSMVS